MLCSISYMISLICSMPTDTLTISGATPRSIFSCGSIGLCVVDQGCIAVVFASPYLMKGLVEGTRVNREESYPGLFEIILKLSTSCSPASAPPLIPNIKTAPAPRGRYFCAR